MHQEVVLQLLKLRNWKVYPKYELISMNIYRDNAQPRKSPKKLKSNHVIHRTWITYQSFSKTNFCSWKVECPIFQTKLANTAGAATVAIQSSNVGSRTKKGGMRDRNRGVTLRLSEKWPFCVMYSEIKLV